MKLLTLLICCLSLCQGWPTDLFGDWQGYPITSVLGPLLPSQSFVWSIRPLSNGGFIMWDNFTSTMITGSSQTFWVLENRLYYCGFLSNFFGPQYIPIERLFMVHDTTPTSVVFCESDACAYIKWTISLTSTSTLELLNQLIPPITHIHVAFKRISSNSTVIPFNGSQPNCTFPKQPSTPLGKCPYGFLDNKKPVTTARLGTKYNYENCYQLNDVVQYRIYWNLSISTKELSMAISVPSSDATANWVAIGFGPFFPGMNRSDIALGYISSKGDQCARSMTAYEIVGTPVDTTAMKLQNTVVSYDQGILTFQFVRSMDSGYNPIPLDPMSPPGFTIIWATGSGPIVDCASEPPYHGPNRGYRVINFQYPQKSFDKYRMCT